MRADHLKQLLKNGVYRTLGEAATGAGVIDGDDERTLRVLMYHKVNDEPENPVTVPVSLFDEQLAQLGELGYSPVSLDDVLAYYGDGVPLPPRAVLITFDDGYRDNLDNAVPVLQRHGYPAVLFVPIGYLDGPRPLPHEEHLAGRGFHNRTLQWEDLAELEAAGVRVESHGIGHRPLADLEVDEAAREITLSKLRLEEALGRPVRAFAYVKGSEAHYRLVHLSLLKQAGYEVAFTSISGANGPNTDPLQLHRYNVEPFPERTFELVLAGACDLIAVKDTVAGTHARRLFNAALGTSSQMTDYKLVSYLPEHREDYLRLLHDAWGEGSMSGEEFDWWFDGNPAGSLRSVAVLDGNVVGVAAHSLYRMVLEGEAQTASFSVHATTDPAARGRGIFVELERKHEREATERGVACVLAFASAPTVPLFLGPLGWTEIGKLRVWARPVSARVSGQAVASLDVPGDAAGGWPNHIIRDAAYLRWRYLDSPRGYEAVRTDSGYVVVWPAKRHRGRTIAVLADLAGSNALLGEARRRSRARLLFALPAPEQRGAYLAAGFLPTPQTLNFMGKALAGRLNTDPRAWRFTLGDTDFF